MRTHCEFLNCACKSYLGTVDAQCLICSHGHCWHHLKCSPFLSSRPSARKPTYEKVFVVFALPMVPQLPKDEPITCPDIVNLPV